MFEEKMNPGSLYLMLMCGWGEWLGIQLYWNRPGWLAYPATQGLLRFYLPKTYSRTYRYVLKAIYV